MAEQEEHDPQYKPVHQLTDKDVIETKTLEEDEDVIFKMRAKLFRFDSTNNEWKERGTGDVRILSHQETKKVRLVMRRDKTLKVCANHYITSDMRLQPNIGSDRSWVWKVAADVSEGAPQAETLAIRFANSENANHFKEAFEAGQKTNIEIAGKIAESGKTVADKTEVETTEEPAEKQEPLSTETEGETAEPTGIETGLVSSASVATALVGVVDTAETPQEDAAEPTDPSAEL